MMSSNSSEQTSFPPLPKISGVLYNCALNCALPTLFKKIREIAANQQASLDYLEYSASYELLKTCFQDWYDLTDELTWSEFSRFIHRYSFSEIELILAPVIRQFIARQAVLQGTDENLIMLRDIVDNPLKLIPEEMIEFYTSNPGLDLEFATPGRYLALENLQANDYFYQPFGLRMRVFNWNGTKYVRESISTNLTGELIDVYLRNGHYELQPDYLVSAAHENFPNSELGSFRDRISSDLTSVTTNKVLGDMISFVRQNVTGTQIEKQPLSFINYYTFAKEKNLHNLDRCEGRLTFAAILLLLIEYDNDARLRQQAKNYLSRLDEGGKCLSKTIDQIASDVIDIWLPLLVQVHQHTPHDVVANKTPQSFISRDELNQILSTYKTTYVVYNFVIWCLSFGFYGYSRTILALRQLLNNHQEKKLFNKDEIGDAINQASNTDSRRADRYQFFMKGKTTSAYPDTGTDRVLTALRQKF